MSAWRPPYPKFGKGPCLQRVPRTAERLGLDLPSFGRDGVVIVGSNGKGSTAAMTAALLDHASGPTGLFTSPHLMDINERFRIAGADIEDGELAYHGARVAEAAEAAGEAGNIGAFEFLFLIAADWFAARKCRHTVWEAGIGGRLDPVRLIAARRLALTSLDLEHTDLLGAELGEIAGEKLGAAPTGASVFVGAACASERATIEAHARAGGIEVSWVARALALETMALAGAHQRRNAALAIALARAATHTAIGDDAVARALATVRWPGRLEALSREPLIVIDVGHSPDAVRQALEGFKALQGNRPSTLICGVSQNKNQAEIVGILAPAFAKISCTAARHKGADPQLIATHVRAANPGAAVRVIPSLVDAREAALSAAAGGSIYVAGGLFLAAEFRALHLGRDPGTLSFL